MQPAPGLASKAKRAAHGKEMGMRKGMPVVPASFFGMVLGLAGPGCP
jgi:hypothetical protein